jgi:hypothetical protein
MYNTIVCDPHFKGIIIIIIIFKILQRCVYTCPSIHACANKCMQAQIHGHGQNSCPSASDVHHVGKGPQISWVLSCSGHRNFCDKICLSV